MNKNKSSGNEQIVLFGWNKVLSDAEQALKSAKVRVRQLKKVVADLKIKVASAEPLPEFLQDGKSTQI